MSGAFISSDAAILTNPLKYALSLRESNEKLSVIFASPENAFPKNTYIKNREAAKSNIFTMALRLSGYNFVNITKRHTAAIILAATSSGTMTTNPNTITKIETIIETTLDFFSRFFQIFIIKK